MKPVCCDQIFKQASSEGIGENIKEKQESHPRMVYIQVGKFLIISMFSMPS
jgi:hypothetical protein